MYHTRFTYPKSPWLERDAIMAGEMPRIISDDSQNPWLWFCFGLRILADKRLQLIDTWVFDYWIWFTLHGSGTVLWSENPGFQKKVLRGSFEWKDYHYGHVWWRLQFMKTSLTARLSKSEGNHPYISFHVFVGDFFTLKGCTLRGILVFLHSKSARNINIFLANKRQTYYPGN